MKKLYLLKTMLLLCALVAGSSAWANPTTGTINFGSATGSTKIEGSSYSGTGTVTYTDSGKDSQDNTWTITTVTSKSKSFTQNASYSQIGSGNYPVTSITFTTTLSEDVNITAFSAKFGGFNGTAGSVTLKVGDTSVGSGSLNGTTDVTVTSTSNATGKVLTITVTGIAKGVKVYNISYTYETGEKSDPTISFNNGSISVGRTLDLSTLFTSNSSGVVTYSIISGNNYATLSGSTLTAIAEGSVTVKAEQAATSTYNAAEVSATITVNPALILSSIAITTPPSKISYTEGEVFDATGMVVTATYSDQSTENVTSLCTYSPTEALTTSVTDITVSYTENSVTKTATQAITVTPYVQPLTVTATFNGSNFEATDSGVKAERTYSVHNVTFTAWSNSNATNLVNYSYNDHVRFYGSSHLKIEAPAGYVIEKVVFTEGDKWDGGVTATSGTYTADTKTWVGEDPTVQFDFTNQNRIASVSITLAKKFAFNFGVSPESAGTIEVLDEDANEVTTGNKLEEGTELTLSAVANTGYTFANWTAEGLTIDEADIAKADLDIVMPANEVTLTANFTVNSYKLNTISANGSLTVTVNGEEWNGTDDIAFGSTVEVSVAANEGFKFIGWTITGTTLVDDSENPTSFTMPAEEVTLTANFEAVVTHKINWSVNGSIIKTENVEENTAIDLTAPISGIPAGYVFKGWVVAANRIDGTTDTYSSSNYVTSANSTEDITYYAVMAIESGSLKTASLTGDEIASNFASPAMSYSDEEKTYTDTDDNMTWAAKCTTNTGRHWIQLKNDANVYIKATAPANITEVKVKISNPQNTSGGVDDITKHGAFNGNVNLDNVQSTNTGTYGTASYTTVSDNIMKIVPTSDSETLYIHVDTGARIWNVDVTYSDATYSNYCTTVPPIEVTITSAKYATFSNAIATDFSQTGITVYKAKVENDVVKLTAVEDGIVPANTGVILYCETAGTYTIPGTTTTNTISDNEMVATVTRTLVAKTGGAGYNYIMQSDGTDGIVFNIATKDGAYMPAGKAYLSTLYLAPGGGEARLSVVFADEAQGIGATLMNSEERIVNSDVFDLQGRRVAHPTKGLYIVNGKKTVVK